METVGAISTIILNRPIHTIKYYNCSNYVDNRGTCFNTNYIRLDSLSDRVLGELQKLIKATKSKGRSLLQSHGITGKHSEANGVATKNR